MTSGTTVVVIHLMISLKLFLVTLEVTINRLLCLMSLSYLFQTGF